MQDFAHSRKYQESRHLHGISDQTTEISPVRVIPHPLPGAGGVFAATREPLSFPAAPVTNALAHRSVKIGSTWAIWPNYSRVTVGSPSDMQSFQTAFLEVMQLPDGKLNALAHPYPHLLQTHAC